MRRPVVATLAATVAFSTLAAPSAGARSGGNVTPPPAPVEEGGPDVANDPTGLPVPSPLPGGSSRSAPASPSFGFGIDDLSRYVGQSTCSPTAKPGTIALRNLLLRAYPQTGDLGITRQCSIGGTSEHKEGRAFDWKVSATDPTQKAMADQLLAWLLATDSHGHLWANARRLGIMYVIFNHRIWKSYEPLAGWQAYTGPNPHTDHVHFSLSWAGAEETSSWWSPSSTRVPITTAPIGTPADFDGDGYSDVFFYGVGAAADKIQWGSPSGTSAPVTTSKVSIAGDYTPLAGDFDGNGTTDVFWYARGTASDYLWSFTPGTRTYVSTRQTADGTYRPFVGDFDGNGADDRFFYGPGPLPDRIQWGSTDGSAPLTTSVAVSGVYQPVSGDFDGDGATDIEWYGRGYLPDSRWRGTVGRRSFVPAGDAVNAIYRPFAGDFDGNGADDLFFYGPGTGADRVRWGRKGALADKTVDVSVKGDYLPMVGDYSGDGADDIVWYGVGSAADSEWRGRPGTRSVSPIGFAIFGVYRPF